MSPPRIAQRELHEWAAKLYEQRVVHTGTTQGRLISLIVDQYKAYPGMPDETRERAKHAMKKAIRRAHPGQGNRCARLWEEVVTRTELSTGDPDFITVPPDVLDRLKSELRASDLVFQDFTALIEKAEAADQAKDRVVALRQAADALRALTSAEPSVNECDHKPSEWSPRLSSAWRSVYDAAIRGPGVVSTDAAEIAEDAIRAGYTAQHKYGARREGFSSLRPSEGPWRANPFDSDRWLSTVAILAVLRGVRASELVDHTRKWVIEHLAPATECASAGATFAQAATTLMRIGTRTAVKETLEAAWDTGDTNDCWEELLDLSITLAAIMYGHGECVAAGAVLSPVVRGYLDGRYPGNPDDGWGASVDYHLYLLLTRALTNPRAAADELRWAWVEGIGEGGYRRQLWVLTAMLVETLQQVGDTHEAARLTHVAPKLLPAPRRTIDKQVAAYLRETDATTMPVVPPSTNERVGVLLEELLPLVLRSPGHVDLRQRRVLEGLAALAAADRFGPRIQVQGTLEPVVGGS